MKSLHFSVLLTALGLLAGCDTWNYRAVPDVNVSRPNELDTQGELVLKLEPETRAMHSPAMQKWIKDHPAAAARRTILMVSWHHNSLFYNHTMGRTLIVFLDGLPKPGQYWLNPDNSVLITYSSYSAPSRERVELTGSVQVDQVNGKQIVAEVAVRDTTEIDTSLFIDHPWDPIVRESPFVLRRTCTFDVTTPSDPLFEKSAVKWMGISNDPMTVVSRD